jgi:ribose 1,5-bisphosphokinase
MIEPPTVSDPSPAAIGPGRLVLVVGPSGAGKDTLLNLAKALCADDASISFPRRVITREPSSSEDNAQLSLDAFHQAVACGEFAVHWEAHGNCYALPRAIDNDIHAGRTVVANVSRTVVGAMRQAYADVVVVSVTASPQVLAERLAARERSSDGIIEQRLGRTVDDVSATPDVTIVNMARAEDHARQLLGIIKGD